MSVLDVIGVYVLIPGAVVAIAAVFTVVRGRARSRPRYRVGQIWDQPDQLWAGDTPVLAAAPADRFGTRSGGARGTW